MTAKRRALLLVGSPKGPESTSESLGDYLLDQLSKGGLETQKIRIFPSINSDDGREKLLSAINTSDILILSHPLYIDSLPTPVIKTMELVAKHRKSTAELREQKLLAISNNGFPEAYQNETALAISRRFAFESKIKWAGGLALGGGESIDGRPLRELGVMARNVKKSLDLTAAALLEGKPVPKEAVDLMAKPFLPVWLYTWVAGSRWKRRAKEHGVQKRLHDRPYQR